MVWEPYIMYYIWHNHSSLKGRDYQPKKSQTREQSASSLFLHTTDMGRQNFAIYLFVLPSSSTQGRAQASGQTCPRAVDNGYALLALGLEERRRWAPATMGRGHRSPHAPDSIHSSDEIRPIMWQNHLKNEGFVSQDHIGGFSTKRECANTHK
jgi:hypothetical protein